MNNTSYYIIISVIVVIMLAYGFASGKAIEWLKYAVAVAETELGTGTGQLKLRQVYDMFITKYPVFSTIVPFKLFSYWVDLALKWFGNQLESNANVKELVYGNERTGK